MKKQKQKSFRHFLRLSAIIHLIFAIVASVVGVGMVLLYLQQENTIYLQILVVLLVLFCVIDMILEFIKTRKQYHLIFDTFYTITHQNYHKILNQEIDFDSYPEGNNIREIDELNKDIKGINKTLVETTVINKNLDYTSLSLKYIDKEKQIVDADEFHQRLVEIIKKSSSYRNGLLYVYYETKSSKPLQDSQLLHLADYLFRQFESYPNLLLSPSRWKQGYYVYLPIIDNTNAIREKCLDMIKDLSLPVKDENGSITSTPVHYAYVCYPYSHLDEMFDDIHFAKRMGKNLNFYFPKRIKNLEETRMVHQTTLDLNTMCKISSRFNNVLEDKKEYSNYLKEIMEEILESMDIDEGGIILYQELNDDFESILHVSKDKENEKRFEPGKKFDQDFIQHLTKICEGDNTYFASRKESCSYEMSRFFDRFGIDSCFFYLVKGETIPLRAIIYFDNIGREMPLNSYLLECLSLFSGKIGDTIVTLLRRKRLNEEMRITEGVLKLSNCFLYKIQANNYTITYVSDGLTLINPGIKPERKCYKAIYGLDRPCQDCPLITAKKKKTEINGFPVETSLTLNMDDKEPNRVMLVKQMKKNDEFTDDLFDQNYLINSYYSLMLQMKNAYLSNSKGYLLLLKIDNRNELIRKYGNEKLTQALRIFLNKVTALESVDNIYMDKPDTFAVLLMEYGQNDVINECEAIYDLSRESCFEDGQSLFEITYLPISYPQGYPSYKDFLKHAEALYFSGKYKAGLNYIYLDENGYSRPSNKNEFMLSIIDQKFTNREFEVNLQPILNASDKRITGAELLIRLSDDYRKITFNTDELIKIAAKNNKIGLITNALIDYISQLYKEYGLTIFRPYGFKRLNINTDASYFSDPLLEDKLKNLIETNHLPPHFLGFEINEKEIYDHYDDMKTFFQMAINLKIDLICDRYSGEYISLDKLKDLGIQEFKIDRPYTRFIDTDKNKYVMVKELLELAKREELHPSLIGVENMEQYKMITEINKDSSLQGYAFFKPMDSNAFVETLRKNNTVIRIHK